MLQYLTMSREKSIVMSGLYSQIIRIHRPFYYKSFTHTKYAKSHSACVGAAIAIIHHNSLLPQLSKQERYWFMHIHLFSSVLCLLLDALRLVDNPGPEPKKVIDERIECMQKAQSVFRFTRENARFPAAVRIGLIGDSRESKTMQPLRKD